MNDLIISQDPPSIITLNSTKNLFFLYQTGYHQAYTQSIQKDFGRNNAMMAKDEHGAK